MGFPWLTRYGFRELVLFGLVLGALACALALIHPWLALVPALPMLFLLNFFRDPYRRIPEGEENVVSPADGRVLAVEEVHEKQFLQEACYKIVIFLNVLNVHVNRAPVAGRVTRTAYRKGSFAHAASDEAGAKNESNDFVLEAPKFGTSVLCRQIAGAAARRIVFWPVPETELARGQKVGMIKLGSRTELFIPKEKVQEIRVRPNDRVFGGRSVVAILKSEDAG